MSDSILFCLPDAGMPLTLNEANGIPMGLEASVDHPWWAWYVNGELADTLLAGGHVWFPMESGWYRVESVSGLGCPLASDSLLVCWPLEAPRSSRMGRRPGHRGDSPRSNGGWMGGARWRNRAGPLGAERGYTVWVTDLPIVPVPSPTRSFTSASRNLEPDGRGL